MQGRADLQKGTEALSSLGARKVLWRDIKNGHLAFTGVPDSRTVSLTNYGRDREKRTTHPLRGELDLHPG